MSHQHTTQHPFMVQSVFDETPANDDCDLLDDLLVLKFMFESANHELDLLEEHLFDLKGLRIAYEQEMFA